MNFIAALGLLAAVGVVIFGILLGSPLAIFFDAGALLIVPFTTVLLLGATYGFGAVFARWGRDFIRSMRHVRTPLIPPRYDGSRRWQRVASSMRRSPASSAHSLAS